MSSSALMDLSATQARERMVRGELKVETYVAACLDAFGTREPEIEAWVTLAPEQALRQARALDAARAAGKAPGALFGLPVGIKDIIDTTDMPTQNGSALFEGHQPERDAAAVAQIRAADGIIIGKTVTTELANTFPNKSRNPHNPAHTPGGSSSGSAAAVGARTIPLALGTQTGGSVIRPGSFCGVYALKPTLGLISRRGATLQSHTLDTIGVYGHSVEDLALATDALSAHDPEDPVSYERAAPRLLERLREGPSRLPRLAFFKSPAWVDADPAAQEAITTFAKGLGALVEEIDIPAMADVRQHHANVMGAENVAYYGPFLAQKPDLMSDNITARLNEAKKITAVDYARSIGAREPMYAEVAAVLRRFDAILTLSATGPAPKGLETTGNPVFNAMWTYLGVPCVSLPLLTVAGLPLGVQLIGARREEVRLLRTASALEQHLRT
ncbi:MAG: amidase [Hyphomicrobiales bacterium]|nr:MAG: amidase [Hyphomicrobiales bacterium]